MPFLNEVSEQVRAVADRVGASIVGVGSKWGIGSGVVIAPGKVLTNAHNLRGDRVGVVLPDGTELEATVAGADVDGDIAVLSVDTRDATPIAWNGGLSRLGLGSPVFALSNPGGRGLRVTFGLVSGTERSFRGPRGRRIAGTIEHTAPLLPGSSGGPIVDENGELLGINTNRLGEGFYLAIPADEALRARVDALGRGEASARPRLGVAIVAAPMAQRMRAAVGLPPIDGVLVRGVADDGPAARAGLRDGDLITHAGERAITDADDLHDALAAANGSLRLRVIRGAEEQSIDVAL